MAKTQVFTHVRVRVKNRERAKEVARQLAARDSKPMPYSNLVDDLLDKALTEQERELGIA